jgi:hypothetical protein
MTTALPDRVIYDEGVSDAAFRSFHALRIKGFAKVDAVAEIADVPVADAEGHLLDLQQRELAMFRETRALWQLTPAGREAHKQQLAAEISAADIGTALGAPYERFLSINEQFKNLCGEWQLKDGAPNDHTDLVYDAVVVAKLVDLQKQAAPVVAALGEVLPRLQSYGPRLAQTCRRLLAGETNMFTGVMCGSYHDVWMELHEDLILSQGIDRAAEGSF